MGKSVARVRNAAQAAALEIDIITLPLLARTAADAARACACDVGQIVKSLIFEGEASERLVLFLVSGKHPLNLARAQFLLGEPLGRADPKRVRAQTGFAIGGVAPIGHSCPMRTYMDDALMAYDTVWAAGGAPDKVFEVSPKALFSATNASHFKNTT